MTLYKITTGVGEWWVVAKHPTEAHNKVVDLLNKNDYGFRKDRRIDTIEFIASKADDKRFITGHFLIL